MIYSNVNCLTHWGSRPTIIHSFIHSENGLSSGWRKAIVRTFAGLLLIGPLRTNKSGILVEIYTFSFKKMHLWEMSDILSRPRSVDNTWVFRTLLWHKCVTCIRAIKWEANYDQLSISNNSWNVSSFFDMSHDWWHSCHTFIMNVLTSHTDEYG